MPELIFDTYGYIKKLKATGVPQEQAEVHAEVLAGLIDEKLVTKQHFDFRMKELETKLDFRIKELETKLDFRTKELEANVGRDMAELKTDLIKWVIGIAAGQAALIVTLLKLIK